jgi:tetratricopeptide (TPR) repeat protein
MANDDWFRCEVWDETTRDAFEARLACSRTPFHRAQYLKIQGATLTTTNKPREVAAGRALLGRVITDYPDEVLMVANAHFALADSYLRENRLSAAIDHLRLCLILESGRTFSQRADLRLAEALLADDPSDRTLGEVAGLLEEAADKAFFPVEAWRIAVARARLRAKQGDVRGAATHAQEALALLADNTPKLPRHPDVGLITADAETIKAMQELASESGR